MHGRVGEYGIEVVLRNRVRAVASIVLPDEFSYLRFVLQSHCKCLFYTLRTSIQVGSDREINCDAHYCMQTSASREYYLSVATCHQDTEEWELDLVN